MIKRKLQIKRETLRQLDRAQIAAAAQGLETLLTPCPLTLYSICFVCPMAGD